LLAGEAQGQTSGYFGPEQPLQVRPEVDAYYHVSEDFRLLGQLQSNFIPAESYSGVSVGAYADWMVANVFRSLLSPDLAKTRALNLRLGFQYATTLNPGTAASSQSIVVQGEVTPRYFLPWDILISNRNRLQARWALGTSDPFSFRYSGRIQLEREFDVGPVPLTPFVNAQLTWTSPPAMWTQYRMEAGLQYGFHWFGRGQIIEANFSVITNLQPSHSWTPVLGFVWYIYF
jgi:hypothetical protein